MKKYKYSVRDCLIEFLKQTDGIDCDKYADMLQETIEEKWKPENSYCFLTDSGLVIDTCWIDSSSDNFRLKTGNCFPYTKEGKKQTEEYREKLISLNK